MTDTLFTIPDWLTANILQQWITNGERDPDSSPKMLAQLARYRGMLAQLEAEAQYLNLDLPEAGSDGIAAPGFTVTAAQEATPLPFSGSPILPFHQQDVDSPLETHKHKEDEESPTSTAQTTGAAIVTPAASAAQTCLDNTTLDEHRQRGETGDAEILATLYANRIAFDHSAGQWYVWNGQYWAVDLTQQVGNLVSYQVGGQYLRAAAEALETGDKLSAHALAQHATRLGNRNRIRNVLDLASKQLTLALTGNEWDRDPWLLGVKNGVVDLRNGQLRPGQPQDYLRHVAPTAYQGDAPAPRFRRFLAEIFNHQPAIVAFIRRLFGYGLTGLSSEHVFPILWGSGRNGKDTLLETLAAVLGEAIAGPVPEGVLVAHRQRASGAPNADLMSLWGKRLTWVSETDAGARLNVSLVKKLTGGGQLTARPPYGRRNVTFAPSHLLLLLTNHKPVIPADDNAIWMRVFLIPFTETFTDTPTGLHEHARDPQLRDKLIAEAPGILHWLVQGCLEWQRLGLQPPPVITGATAQYQDEEDSVGLFVQECCDVDCNNPALFTESGVLLHAYNAWAAQYGLRALNLTTFGRRMARRFEKGKHPDPRNRRVVYLGVRLRNV